MTEETSRRRFLLAAGVVVPATLASSLPRAEEPAAVAAPAPVPAPEPPLTLTATEAAFLAAAVDTIIPADALSPSGSDCGVVVFIDRQLAGAYGSGARLYRGGPFQKGKPEQGYQLALTPREFFASGIAAANAWSRQAHGEEFDRLSPEDRAAALTAMEQGKAEFADFSSKQFFEALLEITMEGFFSDPVYGGNRDKASWKMVGFPGLPALYADKIEAYRDKKFDAAPQSIAEFS
jgi:gluconate 2-dehydrogenase gamma chain